MKKTLVIGRVNGNEYGYKRSLKATLDIELKERPKGLVLSICGDIWNTMLTDILHGGQMQDTFRDLLNNDGFKKLYIAKEELTKILNIWDRWHLNDCKAGCEHQRILMTFNITKALVGETFFYASNYDNIMLLPEFKKCSKCGYQYGSSWLFEELPEDVITFIRSL